MKVRWVFLAAYACSGLAGLIYEVAWVRTLTLYMGHTTAAASTVVAAFMGGMAIGSAAAGRVAGRLQPYYCLVGYAVLELIVIVTAIALPAELSALMPLLRWAYRDGEPGVLFPAIRLLACLAVLIVPTMALGATFPIAARYFLSRCDRRTADSAGRLYAVNTAGAAIGMVAAGFLLIPAIGVSGTVWVGVAASAVAIGAVSIIARRNRFEAGTPESTGHAPPPPANSVERKRRKNEQRSVETRSPRWLASVVLASTGFATFLYEITWTRVFSTLIGPSTYAFAATVTGIIAGVAIGSAVGTLLSSRIRRVEFPLALALLGAAIAASWASASVGRLALALAERFAYSAQSYGQQLLTHSLLAAATVAPIAIALGFAFPLSLEIAAPRIETSEGDGSRLAAVRLGRAYAINTLASVGGSLATGFVLIPLLGFQNTLRVAGFVLIGAALSVVAMGALSRRSRLVALVSLVAAGAAVFSSPRWDPALLASGGYKYALYAPKDIDLPTALKAGTLLYYREGPAGIVSVKRLTGNVSLAIDGKVDASTSSDMLTQKVLAHLPLLLHGDARTICIIGLGSGVTLASALAHRIAGADVIEISTEVVEASRFFLAENRHALDDPRTRLIIGDGRLHLALSTARYDVIVSEPSNPWMTGVASLFTREFFTAVRDRLAEDGIVCQWAHTYDISDADLRSVVHSFASVFPNGTMWLVGNGDLLLVGSRAPLDSRFDNIQTGWRLPSVASDLADVAMRNPFALASTFVGGPAELQKYGGAAPIQSDDRMALEFSGPRAINNDAAAANASTLRTLLESPRLPSSLGRLRAAAGPRDTRDRGLMMLRASAFDVAYQDFVDALGGDPADREALSGLARAAVPLHREAGAAALLESLAAENPTLAAPRVALSNLRAATGAFPAAVAAAKEAALIEPNQPEALDQLASLYADAGDAAALDDVVDRLRRLFPARARTRYYEAAAKFLHGDLQTASVLARQSIEIETERADAHNLLGAIQARLGESDQARKSFETALGFDPRDSATYTNLALLELQSGNAVKAAGLFAEALSLDPTSDAAREGLARAAAR